MIFNKQEIIYQSEAAECGLACVAMVASFYGKKFDLNTLRNQYSVSFKGANLQQLVHISNQLGFVSRALKIDLKGLKNVQKPCILHWNMDHFVVLKKVKNDSIVILDPGYGEKTVSMEEVNRAFTGVALELTPSKEFVREDQRVRLGITAFWSKVQGLKSSLIKLFVLSLILQLLVIAGPYYTQLVVDEVLISFDRPLLLILAIGFGLVMLFQTVTEAFRSWVVLHLGALMSSQMATNLMRHLVYLPMIYFSKRHIGDIVSRFGSLKNVRELFTNKLVEGLIDGVMSFFVLLMMFFYETTLTFLVLGVAVLYTVLRFIMYRPLHQLTESSIVATASEQTNFIETVRGMQSIKLFGQQTARLNLWQNKYTEAINQNYRLGKWNISYRIINSLMFGFENILVIYMAAIAVMDGNLTIGMLFAFLAYKNQFSSRISKLIDNVLEIKMIRLHLDRLSDIALTEKEIRDNLKPYRNLTGMISIKGLKFRYSDTDPWLFEDLNLNVTPGESIAIIGSSGTGKSTLMKLMLGLIPPSNGQILVDGVDINQFGINNFREQVACVMQDDQLFSGNLSENISFFDSAINFPKVHSAAQTAHIAEDIAMMNMGYNSLVGDMGSALSGGQKQRILLARALYRDPKVLFLDEATSHLDSKLENNVNEAVKKLKITRILIAHRRETIQSADKVFELLAGKLVEVTSKYH